MDSPIPNALRIFAPSESNLAAIALDQDLRVLLLTSANAGNGVTASALALASELARSSRTAVLLADASLSANSITRRLALQERPGFMDLVLPGQAPAIEECIVQVEGLSCDIMPAGVHPRHGERLDPQGLRDLFARLGEQYRFVVIDGEAVYASPDTLTISAQADGVVLVVRGEETRWEVAQAAAQRLTQAGAKLIGGIFNARKYYMPKWVYDHL
ncbi:MAG: CpsD/CapB family tyrosine-protein kinase [Zoogloeaceae bacterium]|jgi:Mrp family chromosome partitioning ATPase|nr:CpsD/CapB family tyrosine-protein kinase [Zoogloeaceae bacterium]